MLSSRHVLGPEVLYWAPTQVRALWNPPAIYVTENGCGAADTPDQGGNVYDTDRIMFLRNCLTQLQRATAEGALVKGYFLWGRSARRWWRARRPWSCGPGRRRSQ
jgi:beta-glucosidase